MWQRNFKEDQSSLELTSFSCKRPCIDFINNLTHIRADYLELNFYVINICRPNFGTIYCFLLRSMFYSMCHKNSTILLMQKLPLVVHTMLVKLTPIHTSRDAVKMQHFKKLHFLLRKNCTNWYFLRSSYFVGGASFKAPNDGSLHQSFHDKVEKSNN